jgi:hypothetical protein
MFHTTFNATRSKDAAINAVAPTRPMVVMASIILLALKESHEPLRSKPVNYIKVAWIHSLADEPILLYCELDGRGWERRKVEVFADGRLGFAGNGVQRGRTEISTEPLPSLADIAADPQFEPVEITIGEFEDVWAKALGMS